MELEVLKYIFFFFVQNIHHPCITLLVMLGKIELLVTCRCFKNDMNNYFKVEKHTLPLRCVFIFVEVIKSWCRDPNLGAVTQTTHIVENRQYAPLRNTDLSFCSSPFSKALHPWPGSEGPIICFQGLKERCRRKALLSESSSLLRERTLSPLCGCRV